MPLAPEISAFGDGEHSPGETGLTIDGGGFGAFPGGVWIYESSDRTGNADQLTVGTWNDIQLSGVAIPDPTTNIAGTRYLFVQREDLSWSQAFAFSLEVEGAGTNAIPYILLRSTTRRRVRPRVEQPVQTERPVEIPSAIDRPWRSLPLAERVEQSLNIPLPELPQLPSFRPSRLEEISAFRADLQAVNQQNGTNQYVWNPQAQQEWIAGVEAAIAVELRDS